MATYGILRVYRKRGYCPNVVENIKKMLFAGVDYIVVVVYARLDFANTASEIRENFSEDQVLVIRSEECSLPNHWSKALNVGIKALTERFVIKKGDFLLPFSNEVEISRSSLEAMKSAMTTGVGVVGVKFPNFTAESYNLPRNTCCLWDFAIVLLFGGFSEKCDKLGGMEDYHLIILMSYYGIKYAMIEHLGVSLSIAPVTIQSDKELREIKAMEIIYQLLQESFDF